VKGDSEVVEQGHPQSWVSEGEAGPSRTNGNDSAEDIDVPDDGIDPSDSVDPLDVMDEDEGGGEAIMSDDGDAGPAHDGKRVKVCVGPMATVPRSLGCHCICQCCVGWLADARCTSYATRPGSTAAQATAKGYMTTLRTWRFL